MVLVQGLVSNVVGWLQKTEMAGVRSVWLARKEMMGKERWVHGKGC